MKWYSFISLFFITFFYPLKANTILTGTVTEASSKRPLQGVSVYIASIQQGTITDHNGKYSLNVPEGIYEITFAFIGYEKVTNQVIAKGKRVELNISLSESLTQLGEVTVKATNEVLKKKASPYQINLLDMRLSQLLSQPVSGLINQVSGVRVREEGGMGSNVNIMLNGIGGKGVRIFIDDIPADLLGNGMAINNLPVTMIDHVEIYKGMVPAKFGSDALGGVLNLVTRDHKKDYLDISAGTGSFGTYQASMNSRKMIGKNQNLYVGLNAFYNHSDNNYWMDNVTVLIDNLGNTKKGSVRRFHDDYTSYLGKFTLGFHDLAWANDLQVNISGSRTYKEWQHGLTAETPWGEPFSEQTDYTAELKWKKQGLFQNKLDITFIGGYNYVDFYFEDIAAKTYYWGSENGIPQYVSKATVGEAGYSINGRTPLMYFHKTFTRLNANYRLHRNHSLGLTSLFSSMHLSGHDYRGIATFGCDILENPQTYHKNYLGLALESKFLDGKITNILSGKSFYTRSKIAELNDAYTYTGQQENSCNEFTYGNALKYQVNSTLAVTINYEYSLRLPDAEELFGDFITIYPNTGLKPEHSHNLDIGLRYHGNNKKLTAEINGFYRQTSDLIFLKELLVYRSVYLNLQTTETKGIDCELRYNPVQSLSVYGNVTWQDIRLKEASENSEISERYIGNRIPNTPYLFGNAGANYTLPWELGINNKIQLVYTLNYVHEFFLTWEADGKSSTKTTIPGQTVHGAGISFSFLKDRLSLATECRNCTNEKVYDNYSVQKPGRAFYLKMRISF